MKHKAINIVDWLYIIAFLFYLLGSSITLIEHGIELSLWIMVFAVLITMVTTLFPWLGVQWLKQDKKGSRFGWWLAISLQFLTWGIFNYALYQRLTRNLPRFYHWITITTLLWAAWLLIYIYSRYAFLPARDSDKLDNDQP
jgi:multidrug efflux pump subunit AcrB